MASDWSMMIVGSALLLALYDLAKKASVRDNAVLPVLLISTVFGCAAFTLTLWARGGLPAALSPAPRTLAFAAAKSVIVAASWVFTFTALRTLPVTVATPIRAGAPALVFLLALVLYGEVPGWVQAAGMASVFAGYFLFSWAGSHEGIDFRRNRAVWCAFAGAGLSACSAIWDKYVFQVAGAPKDTVQFWFQLGLVAVYGISLLGTWRISRRGFAWRWTIPLVGILLAFSDWLYFGGIAVDGVPISAASLLRRISVVFTFVLGARAFHERNLPRKALALGAIVLGCVLICLSQSDAGAED